MGRKPVHTFFSRVTSFPFPSSVPKQPTEIIPPSSPSEDLTSDNNPRQFPSPLSSRIKNEQEASSWKRSPTDFFFSFSCGNRVVGIKKIKVVSLSFWRLPSQKYLLCSNRDFCGKSLNIFRESGQTVALVSCFVFSLFGECLGDILKEIEFLDLGDSDRGAKKKLRTNFLLAQTLPQG